MNLTEYIDFTIKSLFEKFPNVAESSYYFDECSETHFIHVNDPKLLNSESFSSFDSEISLGFYDLNFNGSLCFISDYSIFDERMFQKRNNPYLYSDIEDAITEGTPYTINTLSAFPFNFLTSLEFEKDKPGDLFINYRLAA
jgi:hypothetical protein